MQIERTLDKKTEKSWLGIIALLTLNILLVYLLLNITEILYVFLGFSALTLLFGLIVLIRNRRRITKIGPKRQMNLPDILWISRKFASINRRYVFATLIGLIVATTVISQTVILTSSYNQNSFDQFLSSADTTGLEFTVKGVTSEDVFNDWKDAIDANINDLLTRFEIESQDTKHEFRISLPVITGAPIEGDNNSFEIPISRVETTIIDSDFISFLQQFPTFNSTTSIDINSDLMIVSYDDSSYFNSSTNKLSLLTDSDTKVSEQPVEFNHIEYPISNIWVMSALDVNFIKQTDIINLGSKSKYLTYVEQSTLALQEDEIWALFNLLKSSTPVAAINQYLSQTEISTKVNFILPDLSKINLLLYRSHLEQLENVAESWIYTHSGLDGYEISVDSPLRNSIEDYQDFVAAYKIVLLIVSGILIGIALFVFYYSLTLIEKRKARIVAILKVRGTSQRELQTVLLLEMFLTAIIAIFVGMLLSIPWSKLFMGIEGLFTFKSSSNPVILSPSWYWKVPVITIILSLDLNLSNILNLSKTNIDEGESIIENNPPIWQRIYLDLILFVLSSLFWLFVKYIPISSEDLYDLIVETFSPIMLLIFVISAPLMFSRYLSSFILKISHIMWKVKAGVVAISLKNLRNNRFSSSRLASILMIGIMLSFMSLIIPTTLTTWGQNSSYYSLGGDIYVQGLDSAKNNSAQLDSITGIHSYSEIGKITIQGGPFGQYTVLGVNFTTIEGTAHWDASYDDSSLHDILSKLTSNNSIAIQEQTKIALGLEFDEVISIPMDNGESRSNVVFELKEDFKYFPNLVQEIPLRDQYNNYFPNEVPILANYSIVRSMISFMGSGSVGYLVKVNPNADINQVADSLRDLFSENTNIVVQSVTDSQVNFFDKIEVSILISTMAGIVIVSILATAIAISFYSFVVFSQRKQEIGVYRALGMVQGQVFGMLVTENLILLLLSLIFGGIIGIFTSFNFIIFITLIVSGNKQGGAVPPLDLMVPWGLVGQFSLILLIVSIIFSLIPSINFALRQTGTILRED